MDANLNTHSTTIPSDLLRVIVLYHKNERPSDVEIDIPRLYIPLMMGRENIDDPEKKLPWSNNALYDDIGDNISFLNAYINEFTGLYWVWKHPDAIGNPKNICICQYMRAFYVTDVIDTAKESKILVFQEWLDGLTVDQQLTVEYVFHDLFITLAKESFDEGWLNYFYEFLNDYYLFSRSTFCMPWYMFDNMMNVMMVVLNNAIKYISVSSNKIHNTYFKRQIAYCMERFIGFYLYVLEKMNPELFNYSFLLEWTKK